MPTILNTAAYKFVDLAELPILREQFKTICTHLQLKGTVLLSPEGINLMLAGSLENMQTFKQHLEADALFSDLEYKDSFSDKQPFKRLLVKVKKEIISLRMPHIRPLAKAAPYVEPKQLKQWLNEERDIVILDTRNDYEVRLGTFNNAKHLNMRHFSDFPQALQKLDADLKNKTIVSVCTGGIRCEKAALVMQEQGFNEVYQLQGGILKYFEECGSKHYQGECFVYDQRVALDANLQGTNTVQCFACLNPVTPEEQQSSSYVYEKSCPHCAKV